MWYMVDLALNMGPLGGRLKSTTTYVPSRMVTNHQPPTPSPSPSEADMLAFMGGTSNQGSIPCVCLCLALLEFINSQLWNFSSFFFFFYEIPTGDLASDHLN